jgi:hypothetical protein
MELGRKICVVGWVGILDCTRHMCLDDGSQCWLIRYFVCSITVILTLQYFHLISVWSGYCCSYYHLKAFSSYHCRLPDVRTQLSQQMMDDRFFGLIVSCFDADVDLVNFPRAKSLLSIYNDSDMQKLRLRRRGSRLPASSPKMTQKEGMLYTQRCVQYNLL